MLGVAVAGAAAFGCPEFAHDARLAALDDSWRRTWRRLASANLACARARFLARPRYRILTKPHSCLTTRNGCPPRARPVDQPPALARRCALVEAPIDPAAHPARCIGLPISLFPVRLIAEGHTFPPTRRPPARFAQSRNRIADAFAKPAPRRLALARPRRRCKRPPLAHLHACASSADQPVYCPLNPTTCAELP